MTMNTLIMAILMLTMTFMFLNHPLSFGLILLLQTLCITLITGMMNFNFWFSYILFLIMVGGMLILFIYMTSVASNEKFKFSPKLFSFISMMMLVLAPILFLDKTITNLFNISYEMLKQDNVYSNNLSLSKFFNMPMNLNLMVIIVYLLITLIVVVKLTNIQHGPLRQKF
uniref:NADH-ubiquinone oxidoreductase chain 6 n=1 Tax=Pseudoplites inexpectatus TaxID=2547838 RepID=A0A6H0N293_9CUCU|nr:NADH dehydrogenase subunit 6 [Pseudoplites inexpectatus]